MSRRLVPLSLALAACAALVLPAAPAQAVPSCTTDYYPLTKSFYVRCSGLDGDYRVELLDAGGRVIGAQEQGVGDDDTIHVGFEDVPSAGAVARVRLTPSGGGAVYVVAGETRTQTGSPAVGDGGKLPGEQRLPYTGASQSLLFLVAGTVLLLAGGLLATVFAYRGRHARRAA